MFGPGSAGQLLYIDWGEVQMTSKTTETIVYPWQQARQFATRPYAVDRTGCVHVADKPRDAAKAAIEANSTYGTHGGRRD